MLSQSKIYKRIVSGDPTRADKQWLELLWDVFDGKDVTQQLLEDEDFKELQGLIALHFRFKRG